MKKYGKISNSANCRRMLSSHIFAALTAIFFCVGICMGVAGCESRIDAVNSSVSPTENPPHGGDADSSENIENREDLENSASGETDSGDSNGDFSEKTNDGNTESPAEKKRYAEYYADGELICTAEIFGGEIFFEPVVPSRKGYEGKWQEAQSDKQNILRFEAQYCLIYYKIDYIQNQGTPPEMYSAPTEYTIETPSFDLYIPVRRGHEFCGWFTDENYTQEIKRIERGTMAENLRIYAKWIPKN